ncbi:excisionase [Bradyrhizobium japonicum]|uniref:excisionase n=1 Tax=Bradyrhizobium japonicum TaxID=375 RepID=UPI002010E3C7|nr:excisionase [Bradyrhizobium japonicum]
MSSTADQILPDAPLRLSVAAKLAFPDGSMTASGLRREAARGRLELERIAGKDYTTLDAIGRMRKLCRVQARELGSINASPDIETASSFTKPSGSSKTAIAISPQDALRARLKKSRQQEQSKP